MASEAQLASLESRVNPHFFFNTLNSIAALTREDAARAERMTTQLASLMRSSLERGLDAARAAGAGSTERPRLPRNRTRPVRRPAAVRDPDLRRVPVRPSCPGSPCRRSLKTASSTPCPLNAMALLFPSRAQRANGRLHLEVADDGPGFDAAAIPDGHGLALIRARLALLYSGDATLSVQQPGGPNDGRSWICRRSDVI